MTQIEPVVACDGAKCLISWRLLVALRVATGVHSTRRLKSGMRCMEWGVTHPRCNKQGDVGPAHDAKRTAHFGERNVYGTSCASETGRDLPS